MRQTKRSTHNLTGFFLINAHFGSTISHRYSLRGKRPLAAKGQGIADILDVNRLGHEQSHVPADLLEVKRRHCNPSRKRRFGHIDIRIIPIQEIQLVPNAPLLLAILQGDHEMIRLGLGDTEGNRIVIGDRLDHPIEMISVQADIKFGSRVGILVVLKLVCIETHMRENRTSVVHCNHANAFSVKDKTHLDKHRLQALSEGANGRGLHGLCDDEIVFGHFVYPLGGV